MSPLTRVSPGFFWLVASAFMGFSRSPSVQAQTTCVETVTNSAGFTVTIEVGGVDYVLSDDETKQFSLTSSVGLCVWECIWNQALEDWICDWDCTYTLCPGGGPYTILTNGPSLNLTLFGDGQCRLCVRKWKHGGPTAYWASDQLDNRPDETMGSKGCAVTAAAMLLDYLGRTTLPNSASLDPGTLNNYLKQGDGFTKSGKMFWGGSAFKAASGVTGVSFVSDTPSNRQIIDNQLAAGHPVIVEVPGHFVLLVGEYNDTYFINDPGYARTLLNDHGASFIKAIIFTWGEQLVAEATLAQQDFLFVESVGGTSLDVVDPFGRHSMGGVGTQIPGIVNTTAPGLFDDAGPDSLGDQDPPSMESWIEQPVGGAYQINVVGAPNASVDLTAFAYDSAGNLNAFLKEAVTLDQFGQGARSVFYPANAPSQAGSEAPSGYKLQANYPNPFNPETVLTYQVPIGGGHVEIAVYDVAGRLVRRLVSATKSQGTHITQWDGRDSSGASVSSGVFFVHMTAPGYSGVQKITMLK